jgi:hypothetical protein
MVGEGARNREIRGRTFAGEDPEMRFGESDERRML